jgi:outer membrane protein assembly factor BamB
MDDVTVPIISATSILEIRNREGNQVVLIDSDGKIFWNTREITTDEEFKQFILTTTTRLWSTPSDHVYTTRQAVLDDIRAPGPVAYETERKEGGTKGILRADIADKSLRTEETHYFRPLYYIPDE